MSFESARCTNCHFGILLLPESYEIREGKVMVSAFPCGDWELSGADKAAFLNYKGLLGEGVGIVFDLVCTHCATMYKRPSSDSFNCSQCEAGVAVEITRLIGETCPYCKNGNVIKKPPIPGLEI